MASIQDLLSPPEEIGNEPEQTFPPSGNRENAIPERLHFTIEFILDTICAHCYIGLRNLKTAIEIYKGQHPGATFEITCSPIVLNPTALRTVDTKAGYYMKGRGFAPSTLNEWTRLGAEVGINFSWQHGRTGNSRDSHKLLRLALESTPTMARSSSFTQAFSRGPAPGQETSTAQPLGARGPQTQMRLVETIYREYFENNYDLSDRSWLLSLGTSLLNIPAAEIQDCLESEEWDAAIDRLSERNRQDFNAVPVFILQGRFVAGGWQRPEMFIEIFERIRTEGPTGPGGTLSQPGGGSWLPGGVFRCQGGGTSGPESAYGGSQYDA